MEGRPAEKRLVATVVAVIPSERVECITTEIQLSPFLSAVLVVTNQQELPVPVMEPGQDGTSAAKTDRLPLADRDVGFCVVRG